MTCQICDRAVFEFATNDGLGRRLGALGILGIGSRCKEALGGVIVRDPSATMGTYMPRKRFAIGHGAKFRSDSHSCCKIVPSMT